MTVYAWALTECIEEIIRVNDYYPLICHGDVVWCWDNYAEAVEHRVKEWARMWEEGRLVLIEYTFDHVRTFDDESCFRFYDEWKRSKP